MTSILKNSDFWNVCKDDVQVSEVAVHESLNTKKN